VAQIEEFVSPDGRICQLRNPKISLILKMKILLSFYRPGDLLILLVDE
jgi:hypothetical protein